LPLNPNFLDRLLVGKHPLTQHVGTYDRIGMSEIKTFDAGPLMRNHSKMMAPLFGLITLKVRQEPIFERTNHQILKMVQVS